MTTTAGAIIRDALQKCGLRGAGQRVSGDDLAKGLRSLNFVVESLRLGPSFAWARVESVLSPGAVQSVTIGPGLTIDIDRPQRIESESFTRLGGIDLPLEPLDRAGFQGILQKTVTGDRPHFCHFDGVQTLHLYPVAAVELHVITQQHVDRFTSVTAEVELVDGLEELLGHELAETIAPDYEVELRPAVVTRLKKLRRTFKRANLQVPTLRPRDTTSDTKSAFLGG